MLQLKSGSSCATNLMLKTVVIRPIYMAEKQLYAKDETRTSYSKHLETTFENYSEENYVN